jgi:Domain of Unknown Function (DUF1080)
MKRQLMSAIAAFALFGCATQSQDAGWITLVDGTTKSLENWNRLGDANWRIEDGAVVADKGKGGHLVTKNSYKDFQIRIEFWADHTTNSGVYMRCADPKNITDKNCYEANIFDQRPDPTYGTGGIVHIGKVQPIYKVGGKWNVYEITVKGSQITVLLNGVQTVSVQHAELPQGPVALQFGNRGKDPGGAIKWRRVQIRPL